MLNFANSPEPQNSDPTGNNPAVNPELIVRGTFPSSREHWNVQDSHSIQIKAGKFNHFMRKIAQWFRKIYFISCPKINHDSFAMQKGNTK